MKRKAHRGRWALAMAVLCWLLASVGPTTNNLEASGLSVMNQQPATAFLTVTSTGDDGCSFFGGCPQCDGGDACTLRQAIQKANGIADPNIAIRFSPLLVGGTISVGSPMPTITRSGLWVLGADTSGNQIDLEIWVLESADGFLRINADNVRVALLKIARRGTTGVSTAIDIQGGRNVLVDRNQIGGAFTVGENDKVPVCRLGAIESGTIGVLVRNNVMTDSNVRILKNTIGCMGRAIVLAGADGVAIGRDEGASEPRQGNAIGREPRTGLPIPNGQGILVADYLPVPGQPEQGIAWANVIAHNVIAHNQAEGLVLHGVSNTYLVGNSLVYDNDIYANQWGVALGGAAIGNQIGVACAGAAGPAAACGGNRIYGNSVHGINSYDKPYWNVIYGNYIGTANGTTARPNGVGIYLGKPVSGAEAVRIDNNVISGNTAEGILVQGDSSVTGSTSVVIQNNNIGLVSSLTAALPNGADGIAVATAVDGVQIHTNIIAGNARRGIRLDGASVKNTTISGNSIGYQGVGNGYDGIILAGNANNNLIEANSVRFNGYSGIAFSTGNNNIVRDNYIADNAFYGALFVGAATVNNRMSGDTIARNGADGIANRTGAVGNVWRPAAVFDNGGLGIDRDADSDGANQPTAPFPTLTRVQRTPSGYTIFGTVPTVPGDRYWIVDVYRVAFDPSGYGEGRQKVGFVSPVDSRTDWQWQLSDTAAGDKGCYTAIMTLVESGSQWYTTEFSRFMCAYQLALPLIVRP